MIGKQVNIFWLILILVTVLVSSCDRKSSISNSPRWMKLPEYFPEITYPQDNIYSEERWQLGKMLFYDPVLSRDSSISCATCHILDNAFTISAATIQGVAKREGNRNPPTLANVAFAPYYLAEGGSRSLELQVLVPIKEHNEFDHSLEEIVSKLQKNERYSGLSEKAYGRSMDGFVITRSIANFERTFISANSSYDQYVQGDSNALTQIAKKGMKLFFSNRSNCSSCHTPPLFTNYAFENNGLYVNYKDSGRIRLTMNPRDRATFKVPTLRNVAVTAPYMHNGSMTSLEQVVEHYASGGKQHPNKAEEIQKLELSKKEKQQLVAFLESLTDTAFLNNSYLK